MLKVKISKFLILTSALLSLSNEASVQVPLCKLVDGHVVMDFDKKNDYDNGYSEDRYDKVLDLVIQEFSPDIRSRGGSLHILRDWSDGAVNAWAFRIGSEYWLEVPGGMARYHLISEEGFLTTICHELGHLLGGAPGRGEISYEGQADYYAPMKCMERILSKLVSRTPGLSRMSDCVGKFCARRLSGIQSLTSYYAFLERVAPPSLKNPSQVVVRETKIGHPPAQCRFDTMVNALRCDNREAFSTEDPKLGACFENKNMRPQCWYAD